MKLSRIDLIAQNGNDGEVYDKTCRDCGCFLTEDNWWPSWRKSGNNRCISCGRRRNKSWDTPERAKDRKLKSIFGISLEDYNALLESQEGCCNICGSHESNFKESLHVDHCHITGKIRGLLCSTCNTGIGCLRDSVELLEEAIRYLKDE